MEIILGSLVSLIAQIVKRYLGTKEWATLAVVLGLSLTGAAVYLAFERVGYADALKEILITAGAFYAFIIRRFEVK